MRNWWTILLVMCVGVLIASFRVEEGFRPKEKLSEYNFFKGELNRLQANDGVFSYTLNTPLFSNYAEKLRFVQLPRGTIAKYNDSSVLEFPVGTILIKNFYYPDDFRKAQKGRKILETRLLVHTEEGWEAVPYIWNESQTEAFYDPAGETMHIEYVDNRGKKVSTPYVIPNKNQCKGCHASYNKLVPIGPSARQLNVNDQLQRFVSLRLIDGLPNDKPIPKMAIWDDESTGDLNSRARAYLDANCGHCHSRSGPANTSGLFLTIFENNLSHLGVNKTPVAAGRGAGNLLYDIAPGEPSKSILIFRMKTNDPAIAMPEIGREQVHKEAINLLEDWIKKKAYE